MISSGRWILSLVLLAILSTASVACGRPAAETSFESLAEAEAEAERLVDGLPSDVFEGVVTEINDRELCDPQDLGLVRVERGFRIDVSRAEVDVLAGAAWSWFESQGFESDVPIPQSSDGTSPNPPSPRGKLNGFRAAVTGNRSEGAVYATVTTPCLAPGT